MTPERYQRINELADALLEIPADRRPAYLASATAGDPELRAEVQRLVEVQLAGDEFLAAPAVARLAEEFVHAETDLAGKLIGRYRVLSKLGAGGHGEVWLAEDRQLSRKVAVKVLAPEYARDPEHAARLEREARISSALNHPNIVTIYDTGPWMSTSFIAQEYVDGETLRQYLVRGPLDVRKALHVALQAASALGAAHKAGIIHRDVKPENMMIRGDGVVKVLDFGLARNQSDARTQSRRGLIRGTVRYMSPEQLRGEPADARSDIFSLGIVMYEMVCGLQPFDGITYTEIQTAILQTEPEPLSRRVKGLPSSWERVVTRCLAKDPARRFPNASELLAELQRVDPDGSTRRRWLAGAAASVVVCGGVYRAYAPRQPAPFASMNMSLLPTPGITPDAALSADGNSVAYVLQEAGGQSVWIRQLHPLTERRIVEVGSGSFRELTFSPDGRFLYYIQGAASWTGTLYRIPTTGGVAQLIFEQVTGSYAFSSDSRQFAFIRLDVERWEESLMIASAEGDIHRIVATRWRPNYFSRSGLAWSPDGRSIACLAGNAPFYRAGAFGLIAVDVATGAERPVGKAAWAWAGSVLWHGNGRSLFIGASHHTGDALQIWHIQYPSGDARRVTNDLSNYPRLTGSSNAKSLLAVHRARVCDLWIMRGGESDHAVQISQDLHGLNDAVFVPGDRIVYSALGSSARNIWSMDTRGGERKQITNSEVDEEEVTVSRDGRFIAYTSEGRIWRVNFDGSARQQLTTGPLDVHPAISPDGKWIVYASFSGWSPGIGGRSMLWRVPSAGGQPAQLTIDVTSIPDISPDGQLIACYYHDDLHGDHAPGVAVYPFEGGLPRKSFKRPHGTESNVYWNADGTALDYVVTTAGVSNIFRQHLDGGPPVRITNFAVDRIFFFSRSPDGRTLVMGRGKEVNDLVLIADGG